MVTPALPTSQSSREVLLIRRMMQEKKGSSKGFAAGLATGLGILGAVVGGLGFLATQMGVLNIDLKPIYEQLKRVGLR